MSDQQPTPETPRDPQSAPSEGGLDPAAPGAAEGAGVGDVTPPAAQQPPTWPAHAAAPGQPPAQSGAQQPAAYPAPYPPAGYPPAPGYAPYGYAPAATTSTSAIVGLVLSILSWVVCPVIPAIVALVLAKKSAEEIAASQGRVEGEGLNTATKIISWINIGFYAALLVIGGAFVLIAVVLGIASGASG